MSGTKIKLCGLTRPEDIAAANELKPDFIGFVFAPKSRRYVDRETALWLRQMLSPDISAVGVFVDEPPESISSYLADGVIDIAQLHGHEDAAYISRLRRLTEKPLIQAFRIEQKKDILQALESSADYILLDAGSGGTGKNFDWSLLRDFEISRPWFLAGGLSPETAADAIRRLHPWALDVSSGIETNGIKDTRKMTAFVSAVHMEDTTI